MSKQIEILTTLGLNHLEAEVYLYLLTQKPSTGYRVGRELGKPTANVYKALETLTRKGAVLIEEGDSRLCRAVPANEFLQQLEHSFRQTTSEAAELLSELTAVTHDDRIYQLQTVPQILERAKRMLDNCQKVAVIDIFPQALEAIRPAIEQAIARDINVLLQVYTPTTLPGADIVLTHQNEQNLAVWQAEQLNIVTDAQESLLALMSRDLQQVHQAAWSQSVYIAFILYVGMSREHHAHQLLSLPDTLDLHQKMQAILSLEPHFTPSNAPGLRLLFERYSQEN